MEIYLPYIFIPMIISNIFHMIIVKKDWLSSWSTSISTPLFGANKTWRGIVVLTFVNGILFWIVNIFFPLFGNLEALVLGGILGLVYMLFELPNSWLKRRLGIGAGQEAKKNKLLFMLLDKMDSALGVSLVCKILFGLSWVEVLKLFLLAVLVHIFFSWVLVMVRIKKRF